MARIEYNEGSRIVRFESTDYLFALYRRYLTKCGKVTIYNVVLHIGAGKFEPAELETITGHSVHSNFYEIPQELRKVIDFDHEILANKTLYDAFGSVEIDLWTRRRRYRIPGDHAPLITAFKKIRGQMKPPAKKDTFYTGRLENDTQGTDR